MKWACTFVFFIVFLPCLKAQETIIKIKAGEDALEVLSKEVYLFPEFAAGQVMFRDGSFSIGLLNYNMLVHEMHFISDNRDTLALADQKIIRYIAIGTDSFYFDNHFVQQLASGNKLKLARLQRLRIVDKQKIGAYDQPSGNSAISSFNSMTNGLSRYNLNVKEDILMSKQVIFFFGDRFNSFQPASRKNLMKYFRNNAAAVESYLRDKHPDFNNEQDLIRMVTALNQQ